MSGHGHVTPNPDGSKARCGGPAICVVCARELVAKGDRAMNNQAEAEQRLRAARPVPAIMAADVDKSYQLKMAQVHALLAINDMLREILGELRKREPLETYAAGYQAGLNAKPVDLPLGPQGNDPRFHPEPRSGH